MDIEKIKGELPYSHHHRPMVVYLELAGLQQAPPHMMGCRAQTYWAFTTEPRWSLLIFKSGFYHFQPLAPNNPRLMQEPFSTGGLKGGLPEKVFNGLTKLPLAEWLKIVGLTLDDFS
jgi:hypothetical protein